MPPFQTVIVSVMLVLQRSMEAAVLAPVHAIIMGAVVPLFQSVMLTVMPIFEAVMLVVMTAAMLSHRRRRQGQGCQRAERGKQDFLHIDTPLHNGWSGAPQLFYRPLTIPLCPVQLAEERRRSGVAIAQGVFILPSYSGGKKRVSG